MGTQTQAESVELLQRLIRFDTVNPPGNERAAQEYLEGVLSGAGFVCELLGRTPERPNLVARLDGPAPGPVLCLLSHVDTVLATPSLPLAPGPTGQFTAVPAPIECFQSGLTADR